VEMTMKMLIQTVHVSLYLCQLHRSKNESKT
jgi:hypothetical protein